MSTAVVGLLNKLKELTQDYGNSKQDASLLNKTYFIIFHELIDQIESSGNMIDKVIYKDEYLLLYEEICNGSKKIPITKSLQLLIFKLYSFIIQSGPGFIIRNLIPSFSNIIHHKLTTWQGKECIIQCFTKIIILRLNDCASSITDIFQLLMKVLKSVNEIQVKIAIFHGFQAMITYEDGKLTDLFQEILRTVIRYSTDRSASELRVQAFHVIRTIIQYSRGFTTVPVDSIFPALTKGLEDDHSDVQETVTKTFAIAYEIQIANYLAKQEQSKIGAARGSDSATNTPGKSSALSTSRLSLAKLTSLKRVVVEEVYDYRTIIENLLKLFYKSIIPQQRHGYLLVIGHLFTSWLHSSSISNEDIEWIIQTFFAIPQEVSNHNQSYEDSMYFRIRLSFIFRHCFVCYLNETQLIITVQELIKYCSTLEMNALSNNSNKNNNNSNSNSSSSNNSGNDSLELYCCLQELYHLITVLGLSAASTVVDEVITTATLQLRHSNFSIRLIAANILALMGLVAPGTAVDLLRSSLSNLQQQYRQLLNVVSSASSRGGAEGFEDDFEDSGRSGNNASEVNTPVTSTGNRRRSVNKNDESLQRLFYFHGHSLALSAIIKHEKYIPGGIPSELLNDILSFGIEMMSQDLLASSVSTRHIICSMIRSGGLILSACFSLGYSYIRHRVEEIITLHIKVTELSNPTTGAHYYENNSGGNSPLPSTLSSDSTHASSHNTATSGSAVVVNSDEQIFEIMALESTLIMITSLLLYSSEIIYYNNPLFYSLIESLETLYHNNKMKYQTYFKQHYRYRTLHITLLEIFTLLPSGSYPKTSQQMFIEALRSFRDGLTSGYECSVQFFNEGNNDSGKENDGNRDGSLQGSSDGDNDACFNGFLSIGPITPPATVVGGGSIANEQDLYWKLEHYVQSLPKKEYEAYIFLCSKEEVTFPFFEVDILPLFTNKKNKNHKKERSAPITRPIQLIEGKERYLEQKKRLSYQSCLIDSRIMNVSIQLLAVTFPHQLSEYQDKAIHLLTQALIQFNIIPANAIGTNKADGSKGNTTSSTGGKTSLVNNLFISEEEKKKKEKKTYYILKTILYVFNKIIEWFPIHSGKYYDLDYSWRQNLIDALYLLLSYPTSSSASITSSYTSVTASGHIDLQIRRYAAEALSLFAIKWKGSNIISTVCSRIRSSIMSIFEKNKPNTSSSLFSMGGSSNPAVLTNAESVLLYDFTGYVIALTHLFIHSQHLPDDVQSLVLTTLFDCLRRVDCHTLFSTHVFTALSMICQWHVDQIVSPSSTNESVGDESVSKKKRKGKSVYLEDDSIENFLERVLYFIELYLANIHLSPNMIIHQQEDYHLLYLSILRLLSRCIVLGKVSHVLVKGNGNSKKAVSIIKSMISLWKFLQYYLWKENIAFSSSSKQLINIRGSDEDETDETIIEDRLLLQSNQMSKKYQSYVYQILLESIEVLLRYDSSLLTLTHEDNTDTVLDLPTMQSLTMAPYLLTIFSKILSRGCQSLLPQPVLLIPHSTSLHRFFTPKNLFLLARILSIAYTKHATSLKVDKFFPYLYTLLEINYKSFCRVTFTTVAASPTNSGMEITQDYLNIEYTVHLMQLITRKILETINYCIYTDIEGDESKKNASITYWILYQRSIIMNIASKRQRVRKTVLASSTLDNDDEERDEGGDRDEEDDERTGTGKKSALGDSGATEQEESAVSFENVASLLQFYKEEGMLDYLPLTLFSSRSFYKSIAIGLMNDILANIVGLREEGASSIKRFHSSLIEGRSTLQQRLNTSNPSSLTITKHQQQSQRVKFTKKEVMQLPVSLSCFLNDLISMACMISMYSINDKNIYTIQNIGMETLFYLIELFITTIDPDAVISNDIGGGMNEEDHRILVQYLSQLLGSIRYTFNIPIQQHTIIHEYSQKILNQLILSGFIQDKVVMKRLFKTFTAYYDEQVKLIKSLPSTSFRKSLKHAYYNEWFSLQQSLVYDTILIRYLLFIALGSSSSSSSSPLSNVSYLFTMISSSDYSNIGRLNKTVTSTLQDLFGSYSHFFLSNGGKDEDNSVKGIIDQLRLYYFVQGENSQEILTRFKRLRKGLAITNDHEFSDETYLQFIENIGQDITNALINKEKEPSETEDDEKLHPCRGGSLYTGFVDIKTLEETIEERNQQWLLLNTISSTATSSPTLSSTAVQLLWSKYVVALQNIISEQLVSFSPLASSYRRVQTIGSALVSLIHYQVNVFKGQSIIALTKDHYLEGFGVLKVLLNLYEEKSSSESTPSLVTIHNLLLLQFFLTQSELITTLSEEERKLVSQYYFTILSSSSLFVGLIQKIDDSSVKVEQIVSSLAKTFSTLQGIDAKNHLVYEWQLAVNCFDLLLPIITTTRIVPKLFVLRLSSYLGISASLVTSLTSTTITHVTSSQLFKNTPTFEVSKKESENEFKFVLSLLWNGLNTLLSTASTSNDSLATTSSLFSALFEQSLTLLHILYDKISTLPSELNLKDINHVRVESLVELILPSIFLKLQSLESNDFKKSLQSFIHFFQFNSKKSDVNLSTSSSKNFLLLIMNLLFPILLQTLVISSSVQPGRMILPLEYETRTMIQKLIVLFFHYLVILYPTQGDSIRESVVLKVLGLYLPLLCQQIQYYINLTNGGQMLSAQEKDQNQQYLVLIGKCLTNVVSSFSNEFRQYLIQASREEEKQLLQYVMKLSMTGNVGSGNSSQSSNSFGNEGKCFLSLLVLFNDSFMCVCCCC